MLVWLLQSQVCLIRRTNLSEAGLLKQLFTKYAAPAIDYIMEGMDAGELVQKVKLTIPVTSLNLITQLCHLLETLLKDSGHYTDPNVSQSEALPVFVPLFPHLSPNIAYVLSELAGASDCHCNY